MTEYTILDSQPCAVYDVNGKPAPARLVHYQSDKGLIDSVCVAGDNPTEAQVFDAIRVAHTRRANLIGKKVSC